MSAADVKAIFLNLEELARFGHEFANQLEVAMGDGSGAEVVEAVSGPTEVQAHQPDRLGKAFLSAVSPLCARHHSIS